MAVSRLHRVLRSRRRPRIPPPLLVVGSLRSGGTCKTDLVAWIAARHPDLAILVHPTGDEDRLLGDSFPGRVFAHADFLQAWAAAREEGFRSGVCDGGLQDPALQDCPAACLDSGAPPAGLEDLMPFGRYRELSPHPRGRLRRFAVESDLGPSIDPDSLPPPGTRVVAACSVARPEAFFLDLEAHGLAIAERFAFGDHAPFCQKTTHAAIRRNPDVPWVVTAKDAARGEPSRLQTTTWVARRIVRPSPGIASHLDSEIESLRIEYATPQQAAGYSLVSNIGSTKQAWHRRCPAKN